MTIFYFLLLSIIINLAFFIPAYLRQTDKLTDFSYALSFITLLYLSIYFTPLVPNFALYLLTAMITIWAGRLGIFLFIRIHHFKKDQRFDQFRHSFTKFLKFWLLQGFTVWIILIPTLFYLGQPSHQLSLIGFFIWLIGISLETIADWQKFRFKKQTTNELPFINQGLWQFSRHPNYFGEILCWLGVYLYVFPSLSSTQQLIAFISPLTIFSLLFFLTGIPLLEKKGLKQWGKLPAYRHYLNNTSLLIPLPPKDKFIQFYQQFINRLKKPKV